MFCSPIIAVFDYNCTVFDIKSQYFCDTIKTEEKVSTKKHINLPLSK